MAIQSAGTIIDLAGPPSRTLSRSIDMGRSKWSYAQIYERQPAVRTVVRFGARNIAQLGLHAFHRDGEDRQRLRSDTPLGRFVRRPNPHLTMWSWLFGVEADLMIFDLHISVKVRVGDDLHLFPVPVEFVEPVGKSWMRPDGYRIGGRNGREFTLEELFVVHGFHPSNRWNGCPPMEALRRVLAGDDSAEEFRSNYWERGAQITGVIERPTEAPSWSSGAKDRFTSMWQSRYSGGGAAVGGTPLLEDGMTYKPVGGNAKDAQYVESRKLTREEVAAVYGYPPPLVGIMDNANYSNVKEYRAALYQDVLGSDIQQLEQELLLQVVPDFGDPDDDYLEFNVLEKLRGTFEEQAQVFSTAVGGPWMSRSEARARVNLPHLDAADELIVPLNVIEGGQASPRDSAPPKALTGAKAKPRPIAAHVDDDHLAAFTSTLADSFTRQLHAVRTALGAGKTRGRKAVPADVFDRARWDAELAADLTATSETVAGAVAGDVYARAGLNAADASAAPMAKWLAKKAKATAVELNDTTADLLGAALDSDDVDAAVTTVLDPDGGRAGIDALSITAAVVGFAFVDTARAVGYGAKQWVVTSAKSRHPELDGETVGIDDTFSNGARWPGDSAAGADQAAGCTCDMQIVQEDR